MKLIGYIILYIIAAILIIPLIIILLLGNLNPIKPKEIDNQSKNINVYNDELKVTTAMSLEEYIKGVVAAEMPASFDKEALKAQAVAARSYTLFQIKVKENDTTHTWADVCTNPAHCQAYISKETALTRWSKNDGPNNWRKISQVVEDTKGEVILYNGQIIDALFHANSGGKTEDAQEVWNGSPIAYLKSVESKGEETMPQFSSTKDVLFKDFLTLVKKYHNDFNIKDITQNQFRIEEYTTGGRVKKIKIGNKEFSGVEIRKIFDLKSSNFSVIVSKDKITFNVKGYGHGVGMSQCGADGMAKSGYNYINILKYYYTGVEVKKWL